MKRIREVLRQFEGLSDVAALKRRYLEYRVERAALTMNLKSPHYNGTLESHRASLIQNLESRCITSIGSTNVLALYLSAMKNQKINTELQYAVTSALLDCAVKISRICSLLQTKLEHGAIADTPNVPSQSTLVGYLGFLSLGDC